MFVCVVVIPALMHCRTLKCSIHPEQTFVAETRALSEQSMSSATVTTRSAVKLPVMPRVAWDAAVVKLKLFPSLVEDNKDAKTVHAGLWLSPTLSA